MRTAVTFKSGRFAYTAKSDDGTPQVLGKDLAQFLATNLRKQGADVSTAEEEIWGWQFGVDFRGEYCFVGVGRRRSKWLVFVTPSIAGRITLAFALVNRKKSDPSMLCVAISECLAEAEGIDDIEWFSIGPGGIELNHWPTPGGS